MGTLFIDFETRSRVDLKKCGMYRYAEDPSTEVLCCAAKIEGQPAQLWRPGMPVAGWVRLIQAADTIEAHNVGFERAIWKNKMVPLGLPDLPLEKMACSAARAAAMALPRSLSHVCDVLDLPVRKDKEGQALMLSLCKPGNDGAWQGTSADFARLEDYCIRDVEAEEALHQVLPALSRTEALVWAEDQRVNDRGIQVDRLSLDILRERLGAWEEALLDECNRITQGEVPSVRQVGAALDWMRLRGVALPDFTRGSVAAALASDLLADVRRFLEIRQSLGKSSVAKLGRMQDWVCADGRVRGMFLYHGAATGRWAGMGPQPQNFPRGSLPAEEQEDALYALRSWDVEAIQAIYGDPHDVASSCLRGLLVAAPGHRLAVADFASIEARTLAWLAGEEHCLEAFRAGKDLYKVAAAAIYNADYAAVTKAQRQIGKVAVLALGYQGGKNAFRTMATNYGLEIEEDVAQSIVNAWRNRHQNIVAYWRRLEAAAIGAVDTGEVKTCGGAKFGVRGRFLHVRLPSGRLLAYPFPRVEELPVPWGGTKKAVTFAGVENGTGNWIRTQGYGGLFAENITQAVARDLMAEGMLRASAAGYPIIGTVHDELVAEVPNGRGSLKDFEHLMAETPEWAEGLPVEATGYESQRYRK
ncbi:MAG TPA: DNA polymerase [Sedimentisphaerales bacterium]|nr:DNA polymerase [Sedimentisphaerales bacterium]